MSDNNVSNQMYIIMLFLNCRAENVKAILYNCDYEYTT